MCRSRNHVYFETITLHNITFISEIYFLDIYGVGDNKYLICNVYELTINSPRAPLFPRSTMVPFGSRLKGRPFSCDINSLKAQTIMKERSFLGYEIL